jgi:hypothetical protein
VLSPRPPRCLFASPAAQRGGAAPGHPDPRAGRRGRQRRPKGTPRSCRFRSSEKAPSLCGNLV